MCGDNGCSDPENFVPGCVEEIQYEFDNFNNFEKRVQKFEQDLQVFENDFDGLLFNAILYLIYYTLLNNKDEFDFSQDNDKFLQIFGEHFLNKLQSLKPELRLVMPWNFGKPISYNQRFIDGKELIFASL